MKKVTVLGYLFTVTVLAFSFFAVYAFGVLRDRPDKNPSENQQEIQSEIQGQIQGGIRQESQHNGQWQGSLDAVIPESLEVEASNETEEVKVDAGDEIRTNPSMLYVVGQYDWTTGIVMETV